MPVLLSAQFLCRTWLVNTRIAACASVCRNYLLPCVLLHSSPSTFVDLYVVFEFMNMDLSKLGKDTAQTLSLYHVQWFMYEVSTD
jgi:hypothetical protein